MFNIDKNILINICKNTIEMFEKMHKDPLKRIELITKKFYKTWDNYSLSMMFLKNFNVVLKNFTKKKYPKFYSTFIKTILFKNININPNDRLSISQSLQLFNNLISNLNGNDLQKLYKIC